MHPFQVLCVCAVLCFGRGLALTRGCAYCKLQAGIRLILPCCLQERFHKLVLLGGMYRYIHLPSTITCASVAVRALLQQQQYKRRCVALYRQAVKPADACLKVYLGWLRDIRNCIAFKQLWHSDSIVPLQQRMAAAGQVNWSGYGAALLTWSCNLECCSPSSLSRWQFPP
jgi:hypothetical protein